MRLVADDRSHSLVGLAKRTDRVEGDVGWKGGVIGVFTVDSAPDHELI